MVEASSKKPRWLPLGRGFASLKLYFHPVESRELRVKFQLRRVLHELTDKPVKTSMCIKDDKDAWDPMFGLFGCNMNTGVVPSSRAWITLHKSHPPYPILSECQVESWATVCIIAHQAASGRPPASHLAIAPSPSWSCCCER